MILRTAVRFAQLGSGDTFVCSLRAAPYVLFKTNRGFAVVLQNGEVVEPSPEEPCMPVSGVFIEGGSLIGAGPHTARIAQDAGGDVVAELRGTIGPPSPG